MTTDRLHPDTMNHDSAEGVKAHSGLGNIRLFSGILFSPVDPDPALITIEDIAHALSLKCRWSGHINRFYSVAEHSFYVSYLCSAEDALCGLMHDASEAYLVDMPRPIKYLPSMQPYRDLEARMEAAIAKKFNVPAQKTPSVEIADNLILAVEALQLINGSTLTWAEDIIAPYGDYVTLNDGDQMSFGELLLGWDPEVAEQMFLERFKELTEKNG